MPGFDGLGFMLGEVAIKWTFRHLSHMMPMWIGMGADYRPVLRVAVSGEKRAMLDRFPAILVGIPNRLGGYVMSVKMAGEKSSTKEKGGAMSEQPPQ
jgi:hypothetical protein